MNKRGVINENEIFDYTSRFFKFTFYVWMVFTFESSNIALKGHSYNNYVNGILHYKTVSYFSKTS
jgi:hypothetical protein